jgi:cysteine-rich repeat protein
VGNGCETDILTHTDCGGCGITCAGTEVCADGACTEPRFEPIACDAPGCPSNVTAAWDVVGATGRQRTYRLLQVEGTSYCAKDNQTSGSLGITWQDPYQCLTYRSDWMPGIHCADADSTTFPTTYTEDLLADDIIGLVGSASDLCRWVCASRDCSYSFSPWSNYPIYYKCGDGTVFPGIEECDDGNNVSGDGCSEWCQSEP